MSNVLDLSGADTSGFQPVPAGAYNATVFSIEMAETSGSGKLEAGIPMVKVQFALQDEPYENRRVFTNYVLPNQDQHENSSRFLGSFVNFLAALGVELPKSGKFDPAELSKLEGEPCVIRVAIGKTSEQYPDPQNEVRGVKPAGSTISTGEPTLL